ncbi:MAG: response regulator [Candidatus Scalindua sp.]|jgi:DNA-binding response OmpR family regulator|nr:response regulator [Candidatus Scalindua sp.]
MDVLIVDDEPDIIKILRKYLENHGLGVLTAQNGREALEILHKSDVRLVITDRIMPEMDGIALCRSIRASDISGYVYIIILTISGSKEDIVNGINAGADDYVTKPFNLEELKVRVDSGLRVLALEQSLHEKIKEEEILVGELKAALDQVQKLSGMLPICATCKKIRDDKGYWNKIETYICEHSEAKFTHGMCPDCAKEYRSEYFDKKKAK